MKTIQVIAAACLVGLALPASADGILEQMENEVTAIAHRAKGAVVTIEDSRALLVAYDTSPLEKADLTNRIAHLEIDKRAADDDLARLDARFRAGQVDALALADARTKSERVTKQLAAETRNLGLFGHITLLQRQRQEVTDALDLLTIDKRSAEYKLKLEEQKFKAGLVTQAELDTPKTELAHVQQEITAQTARAALLDQLIQQGDTNRHVAGEKIEKPADAKRTYQDVITWYERVDANSNPPRSGTGFSIGEGFIVTTADVLDGMDNPVVITDGGEKIRAKVVGIDTELNVGMVKLAAQAEIPALTLGDSSKVAPGCFAISIGNQHGNANAVALNLVAGIRTEATYSGDHFYPTLIQIGGTVGAGTSGAPLINSHGEVIGIIAGVPQAEPEPGQYLYYNSASQLVQQPPPAPGTNVPLGLLSAYQVTPSSPTNWMNAATARVTSRQPVLTRSVNKKSGHVNKRGAKPAGNRQKPQVQTVQAGRGSGQSQPTMATVTAPLAMSWIPNSFRNSVPYPYQSYRLVATSPNLQSNGTTYNVPTNGVNLSEVPIRPTPVVTSAGFAIPIGEIQAVLIDMKAGKPIVHGWIGVDLENQERGTEQNGIVKVLRTVKVKAVYVGSPANRAGVVPGDILISLDDKALHTMSDVRTGILRSTINKPVTLAVERNGQVMTWQIIVEPRPTQTGKVITAPVVPTSAGKNGR